MRWMRACVAFAVALGWVRDARPDDTAECSASYQSAQRLRMAGKLRASRAALLTCARPACATFITLDCTKWLGEVEAALPSVVFVAVDADGHDLVGGEISVDAEIVPSATDGLPHAFDPGLHKITLRARGREVEQDVVLRTGDKSRRVELRLESPRAPTPRSRPVPLATYALGAIAIASVGVGVSLWGVGTSDASAYNARCVAVGCTGDERAGVFRELVAGDVTFAAGLVSAALATIFFLTRPSAVLSVRGVSGGAAVLFSDTF